MMHLIYMQIQVDLYRPASSLMRAVDPGTSQPLGYNIVGYNWSARHVVPIPTSSYETPQKFQNDGFVSTVGTC